MTWVRTDDEYPEHKKLLAAAQIVGYANAYCLDHSAWCYCSRNLTDGFVPAMTIFTLAPGMADPKAVADALVTVGRWTRVPDGYQIHDYLEYNPSRAEVMDARSQNARRQQEWRDRKKHERNAVTNSVSNAPRNGFVTDAPIPIPNPDPIPDPESPNPPLPPQGGCGADAAPVSANGNGCGRPEPSPCRQTWEAYKQAYEAQYNVSPIRNAKVNRQIKLLVDRLGATTAPKVAAWFPSHRGRWYVKNLHTVDCLLKDAEKLHTEWLTGVTVYDRDAQEVDRLSADFAMWSRIGQDLREQKDGAS